jgi:hypothetical protein
VSTPDTNDDLFAALDARVASKPVAPIINLSGIAAMSAAIAIPDPIPAPATMTRPFLPHQAVAFTYAVQCFERWPGVFVGDAMGLGKTQVMQALAARRKAEHPGHVLVIAPPITAGGWLSDLAEAFPTLTFAQIKGRKVERDPAGNVTLPAADVIFVSDDPQTLRAWLFHSTDARKVQHFTNAVNDAAMVIRDELHRDKGADGKPASPTSRARLMLGIGEACRARRIPIVAASGTLLTNRPIEALIPLQVVGGLDLVKACAPGVSNVMGFAFRYCDPQNNGYGYSYSGANQSRLPELHAHLRETVYVRREARSIGNLPHGGWHVVPVALNGKMARYKRLEDEFLSLILEEEGPEAMWRKARAEAITRMQALWQEAGIIKADAAVDYVLDTVDLQPGRPVILFHWHTGVITALAKGLGKLRLTDANGKKRPARVALLNGKVTGAHRQDTVDDFQAGRVDVLIAQLKAAGIGVTLTRAADAVFVQCPWSAGDLSQAAGRILRTDQISRDRAAAGEGVRWHVLNACHEDGTPTFDHAMWAVLERKAHVCDAVNAGTPITMPDEAVMYAAMRDWYEARTH